MQNTSASAGTAAPTSKTMARLPSNLKSLGNKVLKVSTSVVWQLKYIAYCVGRDFFQPIRTVLPLLLCDVT